MSSSFQYGITAGFKAVDFLQQTLVQNAAGLLKPGYQRKNAKLGHSSGIQSDGGYNPTVGYGGKGPTAGGGDTLAIYGTTIEFKQGEIQPAFDPLSLAIRGDGFFLVAENLEPGARLFLTRAGNFRVDAGGRLVTQQGLFLVGGQGNLTDPPRPVFALPDGTVPLPEITLGKVGVPSQLAISGYGDTIYQVTAGSGVLRAFENGLPQVGFVQASSIEIPDRVGISAILSSETNTAVQTYKIFKDMLTEFNKTVDDTIGLVK